MNAQEADGNFTSFADLPPHLIENILSYCFRDRFALKTVCKAFYDAIWKVFGENFWPSIETLDIDRVLNGSIPGCRPVRFSNVTIGRRQSHFITFAYVLPFFEARGEFVKNLVIDCWLHANEVQQILSHTRNLRKLSFRCMNLDLSELVDLSEIEICSNECQLSDIKLPNDSVKTIKVEIDILKYDDLREFLANQNSIKSLLLKVDHFEGSTMNYGRLKLEKLVIQPVSNTHSGLPMELVSTQINLRILKITHELSDKYLESITQNLQHLEELDGDFTRIRSEYFDTLTRLQRLKILRIFCRSLENLLLTDSKLQVSSLFIPLNVLTAENARQIARKFPKLTKFHFNKFLNHFKAIPEVFSHFQHLEELKFNLVDSPRVAFSPEIENVPNANLKVLSIEKLTKQDLKYLKSFPNLTKLSLSLSNSWVNGSFKDEIEEIFKDFPKLRVLCLRFGETYQINFDIVALINENPSLELIYVENLSLGPIKIKTSELKRRFEITQIETNYRFGSVKSTCSLLFVTDENVLLNETTSYKIEACCGFRYENFRKALKYLKFSRSWEYIIF